MHSLDDLQLAITNLWEEFGQTSNPLLGFAVNASLALAGVAVWWAATGVVSFAGGVWAILNLLGIVSWVMRL